MKKIHLKPLYRKFSYDGLVEVAKQENWEIPSAEMVRNSDIPEDDAYKYVWVNDIAEKEEDRATHGYIYSRDSKKLILCNHSFMNPCIVKKIGFRLPEGYTRHYRRLLDANLLLIGIEEAILIGLYDEDGNQDGEFQIEWSRLGKDYAPRLSAFDDSWKMLWESYPDILKYMAMVDDQNTSPEDFIVKLEELGITKKGK